MGLAVKVGWFESATSTGNQDHTWSPDALWPEGTTPKFIRFISANRDGAGDGGVAAISHGLASASANRGMSFGMANASTSNRAACMMSETQAIVYVNVANGSTIRAGSVTMLSDGFRVNWTTVPGASATYAFIAYGGDDLEDVFVGTGTGRAGSTGTKDFTDAGFLPDAGLFMSPASSTSLVNGNANLSGFVGMTDGVAQGYSAFRYEDNVSTSVALRIQFTDKVLHWPSSSGVFAEASWDSWLSDGVRLNFTTGTGERIFFYALLKGPRFKVGTVDIPAEDEGTVSPSGFGFAPLVVEAQSWTDPTTLIATLTAPALLSHGAFSSLAQFGCWMGAANNVGTSITSRALSLTKAFAQWTPGGATPTLIKDATGSLDADGFTFTTDAVSEVNPAQAIYLAVGAQAPPVVTGSPWHYYAQMRR